MRAPAPRTAVLGALFSAGVVVTMLAATATHAPAPDPHPTAATVAVLEEASTPGPISATRPIGR